MNAIPHSKPWITEADLEAVQAVLRGGMLAQAEVTERFEQAVAGWVGAAGGVATGSGSAAIALALEALEVGAGDEVILPTYVCVSVMEALATVGAKPVLADVGENWVITCDCAAPLVTPRTRAIIVPHMYGVFADVASFRPLGVPLIEDCAQGMDGKGARRIEGDVAIFSFHPTKCLTAGEGGMAAASDHALVSSMRALRDGRPAAAAARLFSPLSNVAAALGLSQLGRYHEMLERRKSIAAQYRSELGGVVPQALPDPGLRTMHFRFPLKVPGGTEACHSRFLERGVRVRKGVDKLLHRLVGARDRDFPRAVQHYETVVSLPIYPALTETERARVIAAAVEVFSTSQ